MPETTFSQFVRPSLLFESQLRLRSNLDDQLRDERKRDWSCGASILHRQDLPSSHHASDLPRPTSVGHPFLLSTYQHRVFRDVPSLAWPAIEMCSSFKVECNLNPKKNDRTAPRPLGPQGVQRNRPAAQRGNREADAKSILRGEFKWLTESSSRFNLAL